MSRIPESPSHGTTPAGTESEEQAARWVRGMFGRVAPRYDLLNRLLSFETDRYWRWRTARRVRDVLARPGARVLDLCCGTGDLMLQLERVAGRPVFGTDFCHPMLTAARAKTSRRRKLSQVFEADALSLPLAAGSFDLITVAFGFRNLANYRAGLTELGRVLRPGGKLAILEFSTPPNPLFRALYRFYSLKILPVVGGWISGSRDAYRYLPESVRKFPKAGRLAAEMREAGFEPVEYFYMTGGIVALHIGVKA